MQNNSSCFNEHEILHFLKHYLPAQAPLKDFIHHNTLHSFQEKKFFDALKQASETFGYKLLLSVEDFRKRFSDKKISNEAINVAIEQKFGKENREEWLSKLLKTNYDSQIIPRVGELRANWRKQYNIDLDAIIHPLLFRVLSSYLDQGISIWNFPIQNKSFIDSVKEMEYKSYTSLFKTSRAKKMLLNNDCSIQNLLTVLVGDENLFEKYLIDQQFAHPGWSGIVGAIELNPETLLDTKKINLHDLIVFELLLEIDALDYQFGENWAPLATKIKIFPPNYFTSTPKTELDIVLELWQTAFEYTYYNEVLLAIKSNNTVQTVTKKEKSFQAFFCIDDRECSIRRHIEKLDTNCETYGTPGFFNVEFYFRPEHGKFHTKVCPAPINPKYLIKEEGAKNNRKKDLHFTKQTHSLFGGWLISQTVGFWSAFKLFASIFKPSISPATAVSFNHMYSLSSLTIENKSESDIEDGLQIGFTINEMVTRVEGLLKSTGLANNFAPFVYVIGHGSSSINNPHYAAYDCGACSGRPGSVNARVISYMANHKKVREIIVGKGIVIPETTTFIGALHDTTRDEIVFFDEDKLSNDLLKQHKINKSNFEIALDNNSKERSRRFDSVNTNLNAKLIHSQIKKRSVSLFEPRPELNHATNALCIVGKRNLTQGLFLDRRAFMNSYDYEVDKTGDYLFSILKAAAPVCGGINLEYYFSRVDNQKLGAGTKLPHNVVGLFGVANGIDGDLRTGLPSQMIEVHDPVRLLVIVEQRPEILEEVIKRNDATYEWFLNEWVHLVAIHPVTKKMFWFKNESFVDYQPIDGSLKIASNYNSIIESSKENLPVYLIKNEL